MSTLPGPLYVYPADDGGWWARCGQFRAWGPTPTRARINLDYVMEGDSI